MELTGKIDQKLAVASGTSSKGEWSKQEFVVEYKEGNYPAKACFSVWGPDKVADLGKFKIGDEVTVSFNVSSREYNGRWYTDLRAWRIVPGSQSSAPAYPQYQDATAAQPQYQGGSAPSAPQQASKPYSGDQPAGFAPTSAAPSAVNPAASEVSSGPADDLPF